MKINLTFEITPTIVVDAIIYLLYNREPKFKLNKTSISEMVKYFIKLRGAKYKDEVLVYENRNDFTEIKGLAESIARKHYPKLFAEIEPQSITYLLGA